jgi:delta14-sterol reductase
MFSHQPALIGLGIVNLSLAAWQFTLYGGLAVRMILYQLFVFLYVASYFQFESGALFTRDVVSEKLGWMLVWGDYVVVPFFYSLPAWYLVDNHDPISSPALAASTLLFLGGFALCRVANWQKHRFKQDPHARIWGAPAESVGGRLLVSGFWGIGRKLNYTGELATYCGWTLLCGFHSFVPYLVPLFLAGLLVHRSLRDERRCRSKYGKLWDEYCAHARFRMIPFVF